MTAVVAQALMSFNAQACTSRQSVTSFPRKMIRVILAVGLTALRWTIQTNSDATSI